MTEGGGTQVRVWGEKDVLVVSAPLPGVMRVRLAPQARANGLGFPRLDDKRSFATRPDLPEAARLSVSEDGDVMRVNGGGLSLHLDRKNCGWRVMEAAEGKPERELVCALDWGGDAPTARPALSNETFNLRRSHLSLSVPDGAAYLGFGERVGPLDKRWMHLTFWNTDCSPHHTDTDPHELAFASAGPELDVYVLAGPRPADVLRHYTDLTGHAPMPPLWALGAAQSRWGTARRMICGR